MKLRYKTLAIVGGALGSLTLALYGMASVLWRLNNAQVEQHLVQEQLSHTLRNLDVRLENLSRIAKRLATYDETYDYIADQNPVYPKSHFQDSTLSAQDLNLNLLLIVNPQGQILFQKSRDLVSVPDLQQPIAKLIHSPQTLRTPQGFIALGNDVMLVSVQPILRTNGDGPQQGHVIIGRLLSQSGWTQGLESQGLTWHLRSIHALPPHLQEISQALRSQRDTFSTPSSSSQRDIFSTPSSTSQRDTFSTPRSSSQRDTFSTSRSSAISPLQQLQPPNFGPKSPRYAILNDWQLEGYELLPDIFNHPTLLLQYPIQRLTYEQSQQSIHYVLFALCFTGLFFTGLMLLLIEQFILTRLSQITQFLGNLQHQGELSDRCPIDGNDELSAVAQALNQMLDSLQTAQTIQQQQQALLAEQNMQLETACQVADAANRAKGDFLAMVSHEMRTPLNGVIGMVELLMGTPLQPEQQELAQVILNSSQSLVSIIHDVLDFSKIESGKLELDCQPLNLEQVLVDVCKLLAGQAQKQGISLGFRIAPQTPLLILSDGLRLQQILINLIGNAIKFTPSGFVEVSVSRFHPGGDPQIPASSRTGITLLFCVRDSGIGISKAGLGRLFKPFCQVDASVTRQYGGTGLGLAISQQLSHLLGGSLWVESQGQVGGSPPENWAIRSQEPGLRCESPPSADQTQGSVFYFTLSCIEAHPQCSEIASWELMPCLSKEPTMTTFVPPAGLADNPLHLRFPPDDLQILLAEDNLINQKVAARMVKKLGYQVDIAQNGLEVLSMLAIRPYDIILMDALMPEMDGLEATAKIRQQATLLQPYIIALTANTNGDFRDACLAVGMNDFLAKPMRIADLEKAFQRYRDEISAQADSRSTLDTLRNSVVSCLR